MNIRDKINALTSGKVKPQPKASKTAMQKRIKQVVEGMKKAPAELQKEAQAAQALVLELRPAIEKVVISSPEQFQVFDSYLGRVITARKNWKERIEQILIPMREATN